MPLVLAGATSGSATIQSTDATTTVLTLPATTGTLVTTASPTFTGTTTLTNLTVSGTVSITGSSVITSGTAVATTSGTSVPFTGIPSWVKRITIMFAGVSTSGTSPPQIQIGTSGGLQATGYSGSSLVLGGGIVYTTGFGIGVNTANWAAAVIVNGTITLTLLDSSNGTWTASGFVSRSDATANAYFVSGSKILSGTLTQLAIAPANGTDTFDAGSINILYE
jgi:hypothetical protein